MVFSVGYVYDDLYLLHRPQGYHPERPARLEAVVQHLKERGLLTRMRALQARDATEEELKRVHSPDHLWRMAQTSGRFGHLDPDTYYSPRSYDAACRAAGGGLEATRAVMAGEVDRAIVLARPPGHHAETSRAAGFCLFNNIGLAAAMGLEQGAERVLIVDWDVHHGNGTQRIFFDDPRVLYWSIHQYPFFPGTGSTREIGAGPGRGTTINVPLPAGLRDLDWLYALERTLIPAARAFRPDLILVSAGYDGHGSDPLALMELSEVGYAIMARRLCDLAEEFTQGRLVAFLEGGYDLLALSRCVEGLALILLGEAPPPGPSGEPHPVVDAVLGSLRGALGSHSLIERG